jgi:Tfp pilus assembly protein PilW
MIIFNNRVKVVRNGVLGFTLVEIMVSVTLLSLVMLAMIPTFSVFSKSIAGLGNYASMSRDSRGGLEMISRDFHGAESLSSASSSRVTMRLPADAGGDAVTYAYSSANKTFTRTVTPPGGTASSETLFEDVEQFSMLFYNKLGVDVTSSASILSQAKSVQINAKLVKKVITKDNTDYIISARFLMRNK